tara:strand:+ start:3036 stop:3575 length:540 start_codon:yes stop_codon:yes gene_type:complete
MTSLICHTQGFYGNTVLWMLNGGSTPEPREHDHIAPHPTWLWNAKLGPLSKTSAKHIKIYNEHGLHKLLLPHIKNLVDTAWPIVWCTSNDSDFIKYVARRVSKINEEEYDLALNTVQKKVLMEREAYERLKDTYNILELDVNELLMKHSTSEYNRLIEHTGTKNAVPRGWVLELDTFND